MFQFERVALMVLGLALIGVEAWTGLPSPGPLFAVGATCAGFATFWGVDAATAKWLAEEREAADE